MEISLKLRTRTLDFSNELHNSGSFSNLEKILFNQKSDSVNDTPQMVK